MKRLPESQGAIVGRRAARWVRESTPGQFDRYGPEAQAELQDAAVRRFNLVDTGLVWRAAHSGRTVYRSGEMAAMLAAAERAEFDLLLVGYVSRWQRNLRRTLELLEDVLHPAGVAVWFCDEEILSSSERQWDQLVDESKDSERYSRRLSRRIKEGYSGKRSKQRDPGGRPPFGFRRDDQKLVRPEPTEVPIVRNAFELSAAGLTDREVAVAIGLSLFTVRGMLTSPLYVGRLRDGGPAHWAPVVAPDLWDRVQAVRSRRATNAGRPADPRRPYALDMLYCAACGKRLTGDTGYYRHREPCEAFIAARPAPDRPRRGRSPGHAYRKEVYEELIEDLLEQASLGAPAVARAVGHLGESAPTTDGLDQVERERERALTAYRRDRDTGNLERMMRELDAREQAIRSQADVEVVPAEVAVRYLRELPETWRRAGPGRGQQLLASALFDRIEVLGVQEAIVHLSAHAVRHGFAAALPPDGIVVSGRGERHSPATSDLPITMRLAEPPEPFDWLRSA